MHPLLNTAVRAARKAGSLIQRASFDIDRLTVTKKAQNDWVSEVDHEAEKAIVEALRTAYPGHGIVGEEGATANGGEKAEFCWVIDPLDGTTNFLRGIPHYCVSIGLLHKGVPTHGVIYDPIKNELFTASKGAGAFLNDRRIRVTKCMVLDESVVGTGFPFKYPADLEQYMVGFRGMVEKGVALRRPGAAALDLAYVACGRYDAYWEMGLAKWDVAAGALMVREAGGIVSDLSGGDSWFEAGQLVASTPKLFPAMIEIISGKNVRL